MTLNGMRRCFCDGGCVVCCVFVQLFGLLKAATTSELCAELGEALNKFMAFFVLK